MIDFDEELKKFVPSLEVEQAEDAIYRNDLRDVMDIVEDLLSELRQEAEVTAAGKAGYPVLDTGVKEQG